MKIGGLIPEAVHAQAEEIRRRQSSKADFDKVHSSSPYAPMSAEQLLQARQARQAMPPEQQARAGHLAKGNPYQPPPQEAPPPPDNNPREVRLGPMNLWYIQNKDPAGPKDRSVPYKSWAEAMSVLHHGEKPRPPDLPNQSPAASPNGYSHESARQTAKDRQKAQQIIKNTSQFGALTKEDIKALESMGYERGGALPDLTPIKDKRERIKLLREEIQEFRSRTDKPTLEEASRHEAMKKEFSELYNEMRK